MNQIAKIKLLGLDESVPSSSGIFSALSAIAYRLSTPLDVLGLNGLINRLSRSKESPWECIQSAWGR